MVSRSESPLLNVITRLSSLHSLGHMSHSDLIAFLKRSRSAMRDESSFIFVKENVCEDGPNRAPVEFLDEEDSSLTR